VLALGALFMSAGAVSAMLGVAYVIWAVLLVTWALCLYKAYTTARWKLPLAGHFAERLALRRA
jgi:uncharacterized membrane protein